jgi:hypothetical protein
MKKLANTISTSQLVEEAVGRVIASQKQASVSNAEDTPSGQYVTKKLQHTGEGYTGTSETSYIQQQRRDTMDQGPNTGPIPDKVDLPKDRTNDDGLPTEDIFDVFESMGEPTQNVTDPGNLGDDPVSDKLKLKKDASAIFVKYDDVIKQGNQIINYLTNASIQSAKQASNAPYTAADVQPQRTVDPNAVKMAMLGVIENAVYGAELVALKVAEVTDEYLEGEGGGEGELPPELPPESIEALEAPVAGGEAIADTGEGGETTNDDLVAIIQELAQAGLGQEEIAQVLEGIAGGGGEAVEEPIPAEGGEMLDVPEDAGLVPLDEGEAKAGEFEEELAPAEPSEAPVEEPAADPALEPVEPELEPAGGEGGDELIQSLLAQGLSPEEVVQILESEEGADPSQAQFSPEELAELQQALAEAGISEDEANLAMDELQAEEAGGVNPEEAAALEDEVAKTGSYKYASFIGRPSTKTAEEERRASVVRSYMREFLFGPQSRNFN